MYDKVNTPTTEASGLEIFLYQMIYTVHNPGNISTMFQCSFMFDVTSWRCTTPNQTWNNVAYVNVEIYNVEQCPVDVAYFNVDLNNVRQGQNSKL